ncbi:MAG TPA: HAMP domain-containing protein [Gammaproteobacteria bacterium]|nr:HAMP domain-containing protein [Gammaproteobacteria bacterium]
MRLRYSLQFTIGSLFIGIISLLGFILVYQGFSKTSEIMLSSANELYEHIPDELDLDIRATYGPVVSALQHLRSSSLAQANDFPQRIKHLPVLRAMLVSSPSASSVSVAYADGDYFSVMLVNSEIMRSKYHVPVGAVIMLRYMDRSHGEKGFKPGYMYSIFYDDALNEISRNQGELSDFDPLLRPWYQPLADKAVGATLRTPPYVFYDSQVIGLTLSIKAAEGVVMAFDITLNNLSATIGKYRQTPGSEVVLIDADGQAIAYDDPQRLIEKHQLNGDQVTLELASFKQLGSGVLSYLGEWVEIKPQNLDFHYQGRRWIGSIRSISKKGDLFALMLTPVDELLSDAVSIRNQQSRTALIIVLLFIPVVWFTAKKISTPLKRLALEAEAISRFDFNTGEPQASLISEVDKLDQAMDLMKNTINKFIKLINSLAGEQDIDHLIRKVTRETMLISHSDAALIYFIDGRDDCLSASYLCNSEQKSLPVDALPELSLKDVDKLLADKDHYRSRTIKLQAGQESQLAPLLDILGVEALSSIIIPLQNRENEIIGLLFLINQQSNIEFAEALSGFAAVTLESRQMLKMQEDLLDSFIRLIAGAIDAKSPYTGGHCQRVPEITLMLAKAANESNDEKFRDFCLQDRQWDELSIACWLHDCGKVTTPEYVVDKSTKLETIYDRIHEIRTRFEVLKRDAEIDCWQGIAEGGDRKQLLAQLQDKHEQLDADFAFVAECNIGGEFMDEEKIQRLQHIAETTWLRTLDDSLGISWEERSRRGENKTALPAEEKLLSDRPEHLIARSESDRIPADNPWGFRLDVPQYKYNRGELYNLSVQRGTLTEEERYIINGHMIQTIIMLSKLPFPKYLRNVPLLAGSHHETMDGQGYPKKLKMSEQPLAARMMVIADIFEALTAADRPYKKAKTLSESIRILSFMRNDNHIDPDLFELFLRSGVYLEYANRFLKPEQIDPVNIDDYLSVG